MFRPPRKMDHQRNRPKHWQSQWHTNVQDIGRASGIQPRCPLRAKDPNSVPLALPVPCFYLLSNAYFFPAGFMVK